MPLFSPAPRRDRRRRRATQRRTWLRLPFLLRGNRKARAAVPVVSESGETIPNDSYGRPTRAPASSRALWRGLLRGLLGLALVGALVGSVVGVRHVARTRPEFAIRAVRLGATPHISEARLRQLAGVEPGQNLFTVDLNEVRRRVAQDPWVRSARVRRELPATISVEVEEREAAALLALEALYLVEPSGAVFKRATAEEALGHPVITGIGRDFFLEAREESAGLLREALAAHRTYEETARLPSGERRRPPLGELHVDAINGLLLYTQSGTAIRLGRGEPAELQRRLRRLDVVLAALQRGAAGNGPQQAQSIYLDNRAHPEHVTVRLTPPRQ